MAFGRESVSVEGSLVNNGVFMVECDDDTGCFISE